MILILGGTSESRELAERLENEKIKYYLSTATEYGSQLAKESVSAQEKVLSGRMDRLMLKELMKDKAIDMLIDVTHPFAELVSQNAMAVCEEMRVAYYRYERQDTKRHEGVYYVDDVEKAVEVAKSFGEKTFLTTGSKMLEEFVKFWDVHHYIIRVLPTSSVLQKCEELGFLAKQIIAMQGPFSYGLNREQYLSYDCQSVISKDSGMAGGVDDKIRSALDLGLPCIVIKRPQIEYRNIFRTLDDLILEIRRKTEEV